MTSRYASSHHERRVIETLVDEPFGLSASELYIAIMSPLSPEVFNQILAIMVREKQISQIGYRYRRPFTSNR